METIKNFEELSRLNTKEKFYVVSEGEVKSYIFCALNPVAPTIVAIPSWDYASAITFRKIDFEYGAKVFLKGEYVSSQVGEIMVSQLNDRISSVRGIYLKQEA